jgi:hypothetical protein
MAGLLEDGTAAPDTGGLFGLPANFDVGDALGHLYSRVKSSLVPEASPLWPLDSPVGTERVGGDVSAGMPSPDVSPVVGLLGDRPVTAAAHQRALDLASTMAQFGPADIGAIKMAHPFELDPYALKPADNLTAEQKSAVDHYSNGSLYLNGPTPEAEALRQHLDTAIAGSKLSDNARLYRGFSLPAEEIENIKPGDIVPLSSGYVSTTTSKEKARGFADDDTGGDVSVVAELRVPKGHSALHVSTPPDIQAQFAQGDQHEVLLPRNMQFKVHSIKETSDGRYEMLVLPEQSQ